MNCPHCHSPRVKKNGHTFYGKQNHQCTACRRQFVESGPDWFVSTEDKKLIDKLLLERISLAGICRVCGVSETWLLKYIKELYRDLPDDLNAEACLPDVDVYLADRLDEEIDRIGAFKKKTTAYQQYVHVMDEPLFEPAEGLPPLADIENNDLLVNELYSQERGRRVEFFGLQLDEMWSFVQKKKQKVWLWLALNPDNKQIVAFHVGGRSGVDAQLFYEQIPADFKGRAGFFSDYWPAYVRAFAQEEHFGVGKESGLTAYIERFNCTLRQRASRLVRKALSFSKSLKNHIGAIKYFICNYNIMAKALHF